MAYPLKTGRNSAEVSLKKEHPDIQPGTSERVTRTQGCADSHRTGTEKTPPIAIKTEIVGPTIKEIDLSELESQLDALKRWIADKKATL